MAFRLSVASQNKLCDEMTKMIAGTTGTAGTAHLYIYAGTQATSATCGSTGTVEGSYGTFLCEIINIGWASGTLGTAALASTAGYAGTAVATGTAGWARLERIAADGTYRIDGDVGTSANNVFTINVKAIASSASVTLLSADIYMA